MSVLFRLGLPVRTYYIVYRREAARTALRGSPFFRTWDPLAFENYIDHALCPDAGSPGSVRLKMSPMLVGGTFPPILLKH